MAQCFAAARMTSDRAYRLIEFCVWVLVVSAAVTLVLGFLSLITGGGLVLLKFLLFVVGFLVFGFGSLGLQPKSPRRDRKLITAEGDEEFRFEERVQEVPPLRDDWLPLADRVSRDTKLFVTGLVLLGVSLGMEVLLGVVPG